MEVGLAATVLALTLVGMIQVIESGSQMLDVSRKQILAGQIIHSEIDQLRLQSWNTISTALPSSPTSLTSASSPIYLDPSIGGNFTCQYWANPVNDAGGNAITVMQVTFTVTWTGIAGQTYTRTGTTYIGQNGLNLSYQRS